MSKVLKTTAIVLRKRNIREKDLLVTIFTKDFGKLLSTAYGVKKITGRRISKLDTGNLIKIILGKKNQRYHLRDCTLISGLSSIKNNYDKVQLLYVYLFVIERILPENEIERNVFDLTILFFKDLAKREKVDNTFTANYLNKMLKLLGYIRTNQPYDELKWTIEELINEKLPAF